MTKEIFEDLLDKNDITWNDVVEIIAINPHYRWWKFNSKTISFVGALDYTIDDGLVTICTDDSFELGIDGLDRYLSSYMWFEFSEILSFKKIK